MRKLILALFFSQIAISSLFAQATADPNLDLNMAPPTVALNTNSIMEATVNNFGSRDIVANSLIVQISVGSNAEMIGLDPSSSSDWTIISSPAGASNTWRLQNTSGVITQFDPFPIPIKIIVKGVALGGPSNILGNIAYKVGANPLLGGAPSATQGNTDATNDNPITSLTVVNVLAVSLTDITSTASDCSAKIAWNTAREDAGSTFDVEYSPDGARFVKVGTVAGRSATGANYEYSYSQGNGKGFYRLKIGAATGGDTYSKVVNVTTKCNEKKVFIYPNPIQNLQDLHVNVTNFFGAVKGDLINAAGQIILTKKLVNGANLVKIANLAEGVYTFKVTDEAKEIQNFKIVVVK